MRTVRELREAGRKAIARQKEIVHLLDQAKKAFG